MFYAVFIVILHKLKENNHEFKKCVCNYAQIWGEFMPNTEAMKKAREKYKDNKSRINTDIDKQIYDIMLQYCKQKDMTKKEFIEKCILYYTDNNW